MEGEADPPAAAADVPAPSQTGSPPDEEEPEATGPPDGPMYLAPRSMRRDPSTAPFHHTVIIKNITKQNAQIDERG